MSVDASRSCFLIESLLNKKPKEEFISAEDEEEDDDEDECSFSEVTSENDMDAASSSKNSEVEQAQNDPSTLHRILASSLESKFPMFKKTINPMIRPEQFLQMELTKHFQFVQQSIQMNVLHNLRNSFPLPFTPPIMKALPTIQKRVNTKRPLIDPTHRSNQKKYKCDVCEKTFSRSNTLITHKRIHTGEKPFKCEHCGRAFRQPGNLTRHRLTHTTVKPYVCGLCDKAFNRASNLHTHMRTHNAM